VNVSFKYEHLRGRVINPQLRQQSLGRALSEHEAAFAAALEVAFAQGLHDPVAVAQALQTANVKRPDGSSAAWTAATLAETLQQLNASLDTAYVEHGIGA
jgi:hypothetical protein